MTHSMQDHIKKPISNRSQGEAGPDKNKWNMQ